MTRGAGSDRARRAANRALRLYPITWRARYEREMKALLEEMPVGWPQVANLAGVAAREWFSPRAFGWPSPSSAKRIQTVRVVHFVALAFVLDLVARCVASGLTATGFRLSESWNTVVLFSMLLPVFRCGLAVVLRPRWAGSVNRRLWWEYLSDREVVVWMLLSLPFTVMQYDVQPRAFYFLYVWGWTAMFVQASGRTQRLQRVYRHSLRHPLRMLNRTGIAQ